MTSIMSFVSAPQRATLRRVGRSIAPYWPLLLVAFVAVVFPQALLAQAGDIFASANGWMKKAIWVVGYILILGGLLLILQGGFGVKEGRGGWPAIAVGIVIVFIGIKVAATKGEVAAGDLFG